MGFLAKCKTYIAMPIAVAGKLISSAGQTLFGTQKAVNYILKDNNNLNPINIAVSAVSIVSNFFINCVTRIPALYYKFRDKPTQSNPIAQPSTCCAKTADCLCGGFSPCPSGSAYFALRASGAVSSLFTSINAYLGTIALSEFIGYFTSTDVHDGSWVDYTVQASAVLLAVTSFASYYTYNLRKVEESSRKLAQYLEDKKDPLRAEENALTKKHAFAWFIAGFSILSAPFLAYFSTKHALVKIPKGNLIPDLALKAISGGSSVSSLVTTAAINVPSIHSFLDDSTLRCPETTRFKVLRYLTYGVGTIDSVLTGLGNYRGVIETFKDICDTDPYGPIITLALVCGLSTTLSNFTFSVYDGYNKFMWDLYRHANYEDIADVHVQHSNSQMSVVAINDDAMSPTSNYRNSSVLFSPTHSMSPTVSTSTMPSPMSLSHSPRSFSSSS